MTEPSLTPVRLVVIADTHGQHRKLELPQGQVLVHAGDATRSGTVDQMRDHLDWVSDQDQFEDRVYIAGNHDFLADRHPDLLRRLLPPNVTYLQDGAAVVCGLRLYGSPYTPTFQNWAFMDGPAGLWRRWRRIPENTDVLVTHGPPHGVLDQVPDPTGRGELHIGDATLTERLRTLHPRLHVFGHAHPGRGILERTGTLFVNAACCDHHDRLAHPAVVVDLIPGSREPARIVPLDVHP